VSVLRNIRAEGAFREPQFVDLGLAHVPFDTLTCEDGVERPMLDAVCAGSSAAIIGARGGGKSSVLAWVCRQLPDDHVAIRVPVVGMDDPSDPAVLGSVALGAALEAARASEVDVSGDQREALESARADDVTRRPERASGGGKLGGGPVPVEVSAQLESLEIEYSRGIQPADRLHGLDRLLGIFNHHGRVPVLVLEDTEAALGAGVDDATRDRFFTNSLKLLVREIETPTIIAVQDHFTALDAYAELRPNLFEARIPSLAARTVDGLRAILARRLEFFGIDARVEDLIAEEALPALAALYDEKGGSIRHVLAALEVAAAAAIDSDAIRLEAGHVRLGIEDWRDR
jgi:hypothetical protein